MEHKPYSIKGQTLTDPIEFKCGDAQWVFPFDVLDRTPGGTNLGRIEWSLEPIVTARKQQGRYRITGIAFWASQTRDPRYHRKTFVIPCQAYELISMRYEHYSYFAGLWRIGICPEHRMPIFESYPEDHHVAIRVNTFVGCTIDYLDKIEGGL